MKVINHLDSTINTGSRFMNPEIFNQFQACETIAELQELYSRVSPYAYNQDQRVIMVMGMDLAFLSGDTIIWNGERFVVKRSSIVKVNANNFIKNYSILNPSDSSVAQKEMDYTDRTTYGDEDMLFHDNYIVNRHCPALYLLDECDYYIDYTLLGKQRSKTGITIPNNFEESWGHVHNYTYKGLGASAKITGDGKKIVGSFLSCLVSLTCSIYERNQDQSRYNYDDCDILSYVIRSSITTQDKAIKAVTTLSFNIMEQFYDHYYDDNNELKYNNTRPFLFFRDNSGVSDDFKKIYFEDILIYVLPYFKRIFMLPDSNDYASVFLLRTTSDDAIPYVPVPILLKVNRLTGIGQSYDGVMSDHVIYPEGSYDCDSKLQIDSSASKMLYFSNFGNKEITNAADKQVIITKTENSFNSGTNASSNSMLELVEFRQNAKSTGESINVTAYPSISYTRLSNIRVKVPVIDTYADMFYKTVNTSSDVSKPGYLEPFGMHETNGYTPNNISDTVTCGLTSSYLIYLPSVTDIVLDIANGPNNFWSSSDADWSYVKFNRTTRIHPWIAARSKNVTLPTATARKFVLTLTDNNHVQHRYLIIGYHNLMTNSKHISTTSVSKTKSFSWVSWTSPVTYATHTNTAKVNIKYDNSAYMLMDFVNSSAYYTSLHDATATSTRYSIEVYDVTSLPNTDSAICYMEVKNIKQQLAGSRIDPSDIRDEVGTITFSNNDFNIIIDSLPNHPYIESATCSTTYIEHISSYKFTDTERWEEHDSATLGVSAYKRKLTFTDPASASSSEITHIDWNTAKAAYDNLSNNSAEFSSNLLVDLQIEYSNTKNTTAGTIHYRSVPVAAKLGTAATCQLENTNPSVGYSSNSRTATELVEEDMSIPFASYMDGSGTIRYGYLCRQRIKLDSFVNGKISYHAFADDDNYSERNYEVGYRSNYTFGLALVATDTGMYVVPLEDFVTDGGESDYFPQLLSGGYNFSHDLLLYSYIDDKRHAVNLTPHGDNDVIYIKENPDDTSNIAIGKLFRSWQFNDNDVNLTNATNVISEIAKLYHDTIDDEYSSPFTSQASELLENGTIVQLSKNQMTVNDNYHDDDYTNIKQRLLHNVYKHFSELDNILDEVILNGIDAEFCKPTLYQTKAEFDAMNCLALDLVISNYSKVSSLFSNIAMAAGSLKNKVVSTTTHLADLIKSRMGVCHISKSDSIETIKQSLANINDVTVKSIAGDDSKFILLTTAGKRINKKYLDSTNNIRADLMSAVETAIDPALILPQDFLVNDEAERYNTSLSLPATLNSDQFNDLISLSTGNITDITASKSLLKVLDVPTIRDELGSYEMQLIIPTAELNDFYDSNADLDTQPLDTFTSVDDNDVETEYTIVRTFGTPDLLAKIDMSPKLRFLNEKIGLFDNMQPLADLSSPAFNDVKDAVDYLTEASADGIDSVTSLPINPKVTNTSILQINGCPSTLVEDITNRVNSVEEINNGIDLQFNLTTNEEDNNDITTLEYRNIIKGYTTAMRSKYANVVDSIEISKDACSTILTGYFNGILEDAASEYETCYYASDELAAISTDTEEGGASQAASATASVGEALEGTISEIDQSINVVSNQYEDTTGALSEIFNTVRLNVTSYKNTLLTRMASSQVISGLSSSMSVFLDTVTGAASNVKNAIGAAMTRMSTTYKTLTNTSFVSSEEDTNDKYKNDFDLSALYTAMGYVGKKSLSLLGMGCVALNNVVQKGASAVRNFVKSTLYDGASISYRLSGFETIDVVTYQRSLLRDDFETEFPDIWNNVIFPFTLRYSKILTISLQYSGMFVFFTYYPDGDNVIIRMSPKIYDVTLSAHNDTEVFLGIADSYKKTINVVNYINQRIAQSLPQLFTSLKTIITDESLSYITNIDDDQQYYSTYIDSKEISEIAQAACDAPYVRQNATSNSIMGWSGLIAGAGAGIAMTGAVIPGAIVAGIGAIGMAAASIYEHATDVSSVDDVINTALSDVTYGNAMITNTEMYVLVKSFPLVVCDYIMDHLEKFSLRNLVHAGQGNVTPSGNYIAVGFTRGEPKIALHLRTDYEMTLIRLLKMAVIGVVATAITAGMFKVTSKARINRKIDKLNTQAWSLDSKSPTYAKDQYAVQKKLRKKSAKLDNLSSSATREISKVTNIDLPSGEDIVTCAALGATLAGNDGMSDKITTLTSSKELDAAVQDNYQLIQTANEALTAIIATMGDSSTEGTLVHDIMALKESVGDADTPGSIAANIQSINDSLGDDQTSGSILYKLAAVALAVGGISTAVNQLHDLVQRTNMKKLLVDAYTAAGYTPEAAEALANNFLVSGPNSL